MNDVTAPDAAITTDLIDRAAPYVADFDYADKKKASAEVPWAKWLEATLGFRNHWYPVDAGRNFAEGTPRVITLLGEEILFVRLEGKLRAIENRCPHRGSRFSVRPLFYTSQTITCWHHTWTFNLDDGTIRCILNNPESKLCGRRGVKAYPVQEAKGVVFIFIGDMAPPALAQDVPPGFLDADVAVCVADPYVVHSNWRLGCEGGYDPGHHFIHNWSKFPINRHLPFSFGVVSTAKDLKETTDYVVHASGPRGFTRHSAKAAMRFDSTIPARGTEPAFKVTLPLAVGMTEEAKAMHEVYKIDVGLWMPGGLIVNPFPGPGIIHNEYYVPIDEKSHYYFQCGWMRVRNEEERREWEGALGHFNWRVPVVECFTREDAEAREGIAKFYGEEDGWRNEIIAAYDIELIMWRIFASDHCRGIQRPEHALGHFKR